MKPDEDEDLPVLTNLIVAGVAPAIRPAESAPAPMPPSPTAEALAQAQELLSELSRPWDAAPVDADPDAELAESTAAGLEAAEVSPPAMHPGTADADAADAPAAPWEVGAEAPSEFGGDAVDPVHGDAPVPPPPAPHPGTRRTDEPPGPAPAAPGNEPARPAWAAAADEPAAPPQTARLDEQVLLEALDEVLEARLDAALRRLRTELHDDFAERLRATLKTPGPPSS